MARVTAIEDGHDGRVFRKRGEVWDYPGHLDKDGLPEDGRTWFVAVENAPAPKKVAKTDRPPGAGPKPGSGVKDEPAPGAANPDAPDKGGKF